MNWLSQVFIAMESWLTQEPGGSFIYAKCMMLEWLVFSFIVAAMKLNASTTIICQWDDSNSKMSQPFFVTGSDLLLSFSFSNAFNL